MTSSLAGYDFGLTSDALAGADSHLSPAQRDQASVAQSKACSTAVLANVTMIRNAAKGAGGGMYITSPKGLHMFCGEFDSSDICFDGIGMFRVTCKVYTNIQLGESMCQNRTNNL